MFLTDNQKQLIEYFQEDRKINALASDNSGQLFAATRDGELLTIDNKTGLGTPIGFYGNGLGSSGDIEFLPNGRLVGSAKQLDMEGGTSDLLIEIDKTSGTATIIGEIGFKEVFGLANAPKNTLFGVADGNGEPKLIKINKVNGKGKFFGSLPDSEGLWGMAARFSCRSWMIAWLIRLVGIVLVTYVLMINQLPHFLNVAVNIRQAIFLNGDICIKYAKNYSEYAQLNRLFQA